MMSAPPGNPFERALAEKMAAGYHERLLRWVTELEGIVRDLAASDCWVAIPVSGITDETAVVCITCEAVQSGMVWSDTQNEMVTGPTDHDETCPRRRAQEWVDQHPASGLDKPAHL